MRFWHFLAWFIIVDLLITMFGVMTAPLLLTLAADTIVAVLIIRDGFVTATLSSTHGEPRLAMRHATATILPLCSGFGSEDPKGGSRDEVALKVEGVVDRTMHVEEALGGSS